MTTGSSIAGKSDVGLIARPPGLGGISKRMVSRPPIALASRIASRKEPTPLSFVFVTRKSSAVAAVDATKKSARMTGNTRLMRFVVAIFAGAGNAGNGPMAPHQVYKGHQGPELVTASLLEVRLPA